jgi:hypothetical protein
MQNQRLLPLFVFCGSFLARATQTTSLALTHGLVPQSGGYRRKAFFITNALTHGYQPPPALGGWRFAPNPARGSPSTPQGGSLYPARFATATVCELVAPPLRLWLSLRYCRAYGAGNQPLVLTPTPSFGEGCTTPVCQSRSSGFAVEKLLQVVSHVATCPAVFQTLTASRARRSCRLCSVGGTMLPT